MLRREFLATTLSAPAALAAAPAGAKLGVDLFSLRSQNWTAFEYLDYCSKFGARTVHFSEIRFLGSLEDDHVRKVGEHAAKLGIEVEIGMRSMCPTSTAFDPKLGTAEEQLIRLMRAAKLTNSKLVRAFQGTLADRKTPGGIEARIEDSVKVLRNVRSQAQDLNMKIAIENHAGDMQARELRMLIEGAGKDVVGACFDSGNPCWVLEDPNLTLETLAPYILTSHIRDSYLWNDENGTQVNWTRMGEGNVGIEGLLTRFLELCPGKSMSLEIIVMGPRPYTWRKPEFWDGYRGIPAADFARFLNLAGKGTPQTPRPAPAKDQVAAREREDFEASMKWTREFLKV
ncbi:sugar phosphate isomerase/epimerase family protein [Paludibaculum fermentans]|uniref:sugar phosphate isomerase/epimerase family protein n=1 Tax=Paludibaculum fermentans TaxID=1473598 RepID=UPI003EB9ABAB